MRYVDTTYGPAIRSAKVRTELHEGSTPWAGAPTRGAMLARLDAFCARYADACGALRAKAAKVRTSFNGRLHA